MKAALLVLMAGWLCACTGASPSPAPDVLRAPPPAASQATDAPPTLARAPRVLSPKIAGKSVTAGISYGPFRTGQSPGGPQPSDDQILEDLRIIAPRWSLIRVYSSRGPTETIVRTIRDNNLPLRVLVGAWIAPDDTAANEAEVAGAIHIANTYPNQVVALSVGNETQVAWSGHRVPQPTLIKHIRTVRGAVAQPVTTADDYNFWNKPESQAVALEVDFVLLHAYAMWNKQQLPEAMPWTARTVTSIEKAHPGLAVVLGETGWATRLNEDAPADSDQRKQVLAPAGKVEQDRFHREFREWADQRPEPWFYFEAFDEPWKGGDDPRDIEKHWGLYDVNRQPKTALPEAP